MSFLDHLKYKIVKIGKDQNRYFIGNRVYLDEKSWENGLRNYPKTRRKIIIKVSPERREGVYLEDIVNAIKSLRSSGNKADLDPHDEEEVKKGLFKRRI